jgi:hypothetical protein
MWKGLLPKPPTIPRHSGTFLVCGTLQGQYTVETYEVWKYYDALLDSETIKFNTVKLLSILRQDLPLGSRNPLKIHQEPQ